MSFLFVFGLMILSFFILVKRPVALGASILMMSMILSILLGIVVNSWWGLVLFLIYVGALLILFAYVTAMSPNCFFSRPQAASIFQVMLTTLFFVSLVLQLNFPNLLQSGLGVIYLVKFKPLLLDSYFNMSVLIFLSIILLIAMISVITILPGKTQGAPLRSFK